MIEAFCNVLDLVSYDFSLFIEFAGEDELVSYRLGPEVCVTLAKYFVFSEQAIFSFEGAATLAILGLLWPRLM